ncbi:response regulator [Actinospongicola halichondriae]|uniref:response regulator n=1 Tax=Actinospongicola halichondriae TaxID=3236844 RepID=UPI003D55A623
MIALGAADFVVIDDDQDLRMLATLTFRLQGWDAHGAADADAGIQILHDLVRSGSSPAVLLDVQMPLVDGWETLTRIRADPELADLAVLMCTVSATEEERLRGYALGADGFVGKPFEADDVVDAVRAVSLLSPAERLARRGGPPVIRPKSAVAD